MSNSPFKPFKFDKVICRKELDEYAALLVNNTELAEKDDLLPFFRARQHLTALMGSFNAAASKYNLLKQEMLLWENFRTDFAVGDSHTLSYTLVEFESALKNSVFNNDHTKQISPFASDFSEGYFQLIDWFWRLHDFRNTSDFQRMFPSNATNPHEEFSLVGVLVVGRDQFIAQSDRTRLNWLTAHVPIASQKVHVITFDRLHTLLDRRLSDIGG